MLNMCILTGYITNDLNAKTITTKKGTAKKVINGTIAINDNASEYTDYINFTAWGKSSEILNDYTTKGSLVTLTGKWKRNKHTNKEGKTNYFDYLLVESIDLLENKEKTEDRRAANQYANNPFENSEKESVYDNNFDYSTNNKNPQ